MHNANVLHISSCLTQVLVATCQILILPHEQSKVQVIWFGQFITNLKFLALLTVEGCTLTEVNRLNYLQWGQQAEL